MASYAPPKREKPFDYCWAKDDHLKEWVYHGCVSLHADGDCEVDGACQSYLGQGQQHRHQVGVPGLAPDTENILEFKRC